MSADETTRTPDEIRSDIEHTRDDLGDTVEALAAKTDVKSRAKARAESLKSDALAKKDELTAKVKERAPGGDGATTQGSGSEGAASSGSNVQAQAQELSQKALTAAKANPIPVAVAGGVILGYLIGRGRSR
jgi:Protein of unknown function (DUF3618)